jgi:zinc D-Ala-D-Ala dipeptidase
MQIRQGMYQKTSQKTSQKTRQSLCVGVGLCVASACVLAGCASSQQSQAQALSQVQARQSAQSAQSAQSSVALDSAFNRVFDLVDVRVLNPTIVIDIRYATTNNFTKQQLYASGKRCFMRRSAAQKLDSAQRELMTMGLGLKIFDGYRPLSAQKKMWAIVPDENYVANPARGSRHNRGAAVDLTLVRWETKPDGSSTATELLMPTPFDDFTTNAAHSTVTGLPAEAIRNRFLLRSIMEKHGFSALPSEWWHYDEVGWQRYGILDIDSVFNE